MREKSVGLPAILLVVLLAVSCDRFSRNAFTGVFIGDGRPDAMAYVTLTQTDSAVNGYFSFVKPDGRGGTQSGTVTLQGTADGATVTLTTKPFLNFGSMTLTGHREGSDLVLNFPSTSGVISRNRFTRGSEERFNQLLAEWRVGLSKVYQEQEKARREQEASQEQARQLREAEERQAAEKASRRSAVEDASRALGAARGRLIEAAADLAAATRFDDSLKDYLRCSEAMNTHYAQLQRDAAEAPLTCNQLRVVRADLVAMRSDYSAMRSVGAALRSTRGRVISRASRVAQELDSTQHYLGIVKAAAMADTTGLLGVDSMTLIKTEIARITDAGEKQLEASREALQQAETQATDTTAKAVQLLEDAERFVGGLRCSR
jgi:hypothetical protein